MSTCPFPTPQAQAAAGRRAEAGALDAKTPLLFLPVYIETRFVDLPDGSSELRIRIFPDQISINSHSPELTSQEVENGQRYWDHQDLAQGAWRDIASRYGPQRAAWIVNQTKPGNSSRPPVTATRTSSWDKPAIADALPDAWTAVLFLGDQVTRVTGCPIRTTPPLSVSLNPNAVPFPAGSPVDSQMKWMVDWEEACSAGMGLRVQLNAAQRNTGFDRIIVYGLRTQDRNGRDTLGSLLDAQHYTRGLALAPQGSRVHNTSDASSSYSRKDLDYATSFAIERQDVLVTDQDVDKDGNRFARLLGIDISKLQHVGHADSTDGRNGTDMLKALWPSTLGYFLSQMMAATFRPEQIEAGRQYVIANALPRGPVASLRVGQTIYGVLPVTSVKNYPVPASDSVPLESQLVKSIQSLWPIWLASAANAPRMQRSGDPDKQLASVLGMQASSANFRGRDVFGNDFLWNYMGFLGMSFPQTIAWWTEQAIAGRRLLDSLGYNQWNPRVIQLAMTEQSFPVLSPTVQDGPLSETDPLKADAKMPDGSTGNYIEWLVKAPVQAIQRDDYSASAGKSTPLLYKVLRQSLILEYARLASKTEIEKGRLDLSQTRETELVGMHGQERRTEQAVASGTTKPPVSVWEVFDRTADPYSTGKWSEYLVSIAPSAESPFPELTDLYNSMCRLAMLPTAELERLFTETLDACSHRLDVYATAIATALLQRTRSEGNTGVNLGCYGWVEDVRPAVKRPPVKGAQLSQVRLLDAQRATIVKSASELPAPLQPSSGNAGSIYALSPAHAAVAAILRNGYLTHKGTSDERVLSVDLSSDRVRGALRLLDAVRQGQSLNALFGYLFEAGLHDLKLDKYIQPFRDMFPFVVNELTSSDVQKDSAVSRVVDGVALRAGWDGQEFVPGEDWGTGLPGAYDSKEQKAIVGLFQKLDDYAGSLAQLSIAEAAFQTVQGNFGRAAGLLDATSKGDRPPEPDVVATRRGGLDLTHRVLVLFAGNQHENKWNHWKSNAYAPRARALAEPWLDAWLSQLLPDPEDSHNSISCTVSYADSKGNEQHPLVVDLPALKLAPLDCLAMADNSFASPQQSEIDLRVLSAAGVPPDAKSVTIDYETRSIGGMSFKDFFFLCKALRNLINDGRPINPQDLTMPETKVDDTILRQQRDDFRKNRVGPMLSQLQNDINTLKYAADAKSIADALLVCSFYGLPTAIPLPNTSSDPSQVALVSKTLQDRHEQASALITDNVTLEDLLKVYEIVFGKDFVVLPTFTPADSDLLTLHNALGDSSILVQDDPEAPKRWLMQLTYVRPKISRLDFALSAAQAAQVSSANSSQQLYPPTFVLGQIPPPLPPPPPQTLKPDRWLGLPLDPANLPQKGRVAFACIAQGKPAKESTYSGLFVDEWIERIPSTQEMAGIAFHYEEPRVRPPNALLLGVCRDPKQESWNDFLVTDVLEEALELTKIRLVDLDSLQQVGHILPALYFGFNVEGDTISANFASKG